MFSFHRGFKKESDTFAQSFKFFIKFYGLDIMSFNLFQLNICD